MDLEIAIIFLILAFLCLIIALMEERNEKKDEDEETRSSTLVIILLIAALIFFAVGGVCMRLVTVLYYSPIADTVEEIYLSSYTALSWIGYGFSFITGFFLLLKVFEQIDLRTEEER